MKEYVKSVILLLLFICGCLGQSAKSGKQQPEYDLSVRLLPEAHRLEASGTILLPAFDSSTSELQMFLSDLMQELQVEVVKPSTSAGRAKVEKKEKGKWIITPLQPIPAGEPTLLSFSYAGGEGTSVVYYLGPEGSFAGGLNTAWYPQPNKSKGIGTIKFSVPIGYSVMATGTQRQTPKEAAQGNFRFEVGKPTYFGFAAARYNIVRQTNGAVPVSAYLLRPSENIKEYIDGCSRILSLLEREFGAYPYAEFALVEVPTEQAGNAGFSGASIDAFILADSLSIDIPFNLGYYGHEIGHQWWGNIIRTPDIRGSYMLGEGMAQYGALRVIEIIEGAESAEKFRRTGYSGYNFDQSGLGYLRHAAAGIDHRLSDLPAGWLSHQIANSKGFLVFDMLSRLIGRERFSRILRDFTRKYAFRLVTWDEFLQEIEKGSGKDIKWFFAQWFEQTDAPDWQLTWKQNGKFLRGAVSQSLPFYRASIEVQIDGVAGERIVRNIEINGAKTEFDWEINFSIRSVTLDPHFLVLHWAPEYRAEATALADYTKANKKRLEGKIDDAQKEFQKSLERLRQPDLYGAEFMIRYGLARTLMSQQKWDEARRQLEIAVSRPTRLSEVLPRVFLQLARTNKELKDEAMLKRAVEAAITADSAVGGRTGVTREALALINK
jgi:hypothetical protein